jgi:hypothetical protein
MKFLLIALSLLTMYSTTNSAQACVGGFLKLNNSDGLSADGIHGSKGLMITVDDMKNEAIYGERAVYNFSDNKTKVQTHKVEFLGTISDEGGVIRTSYLVLDLKTKSEKVVLLKSNYRGNGMTARGLPSQDELDSASKLKQLEGFKTLYSAGCN